MKLQIAFDLTDLSKALEIARHVEEHADIFEVGTLLLYKHGIHAVEQFKEKFPRKPIFADSKIVDRGKEAATVIACAGADWISVMAGAANEVIHAACTAAHQANARVMLDLVDAVSVGQSALEAKNMGVDALMFHQAYDEKDALILLDKWEMVRGNSNLPIFVSAKITRSTVTTITAIKPDGIIIGKSIIDAEFPAEEAAFYRSLCAS